jgi:hypothetical protein
MHFPLHKIICKSTARANEELYEFSDAALSAWRRLFDRWKQGSPEYLVHFKQQPPSFVGVVKVAFNYNYATLVPMGEPRIVPITQQSVVGLEADVLKQAIADVLRFRGDPPNHANNSHVVQSVVRRKLARLKFYRRHDARDNRAPKND